MAAVVARPVAVATSQLLMIAASAAVIAAVAEKKKQSREKFGSAPTLCWGAFLLD